MTTTLHKTRAPTRQRRGKSFEQVVLTDLVDTLVTAARVSRNPLYYWHAYQVARQLGVPVPALVLRYLDQAAARLARPQGRGRKDQ